MATAKKRRVVTRLPPETYEQLKKEAELLGISVNALISIKLAEKEKKDERY